ncbi:YybH family protein [Aquitalea denitrificans]|uniref:YybH family protein n=1 Tax=Aquitalea denitrificans TaxID=519081 RepID=UPI00135ACCCA|nr:nuclear transport factor 2 family protein [Aquitalea denitrificans]
MNTFRFLSAKAALVLALSLGAVAGANAAGKEALPYAKDPAVRAVQQQVYDVVHRYETALNAGDTPTILNLFAEDSVAEWNDKPTYATRQQKIDGYNALFSIAKFSTVFAYDSINVYGNTAVVRTHHHKGAAVIENGKKVLDFNREVFVLTKINGVWKIVLYTFNTNPRQGEG